MAYSIMDNNSHYRYDREDYSNPYLNQYHIRLACSQADINDVCQTAYRLSSFIRIQYKHIHYENSDNVYGVDIIVGESRDCEWFLLKYPEVRVNQMDIA